MKPYELVYKLPLPHFKPMFRSSPPGVFLGKRVLKICSKFTGEHPCRSVISIKLLSNFIETTLQYECSPVNLLHIFRAPFPKKTSGGLHLPFYPPTPTISESHRFSDVFRGYRNRTPA